MGIIFFSKVVLKDLVVISREGSHPLIIKMKISYKYLKKKEKELMENLGLKVDSVSFCSLTKLEAK